MIAFSPNDSLFNAATLSGFILIKADNAAKLNSLTQWFNVECPVGRLVNAFVGDAPKEAAVISPSSVLGEWNRCSGKSERDGNSVPYHRRSRIKTA